MGYYVDIDECNIFIDKNHFNDCYKAMCALNDHDDLKNGGSYGGEIDGKSQRPEGLNYRPAKWFSWMDANYPETCPTFTNILHSLGFDPSFDEEGNLIYLRYSSKIGQEELFFNTIAEYIRPGSFITWRGEDGDMWQWYFDKTLKHRSPTITWN